jgi:hypothetical protein
MRFLLGLVVLGLLGAGAVWLRLVWEQSQGREELAQVIAETDENDPRWRWEEIQEGIASVPDAENSLLVVKKVFDSFGAWKPGELKLQDGQPVYGGDYPYNRRFDEQRLAVLRKELGEHEQTVALAATLKDYPRGRAVIQLTPDLVSTLLPHLQPVREVADLLALDIERHLHGGQIDRATERIRAILHASAGVRDDYFLISQLVRISCRSIAVYRIQRLLGMGELSDQACLALMRHLAAERQENLLLVGLRGERAGWHHFFGNLTQGRLSLAGTLAGNTGTGQPDLVTRVGAFLYSYRIPEDHATYLRWSKRLCDIARLPFHERATELDAFYEEFEPIRATARTQKRQLLAAIFVPAVQRFDQAVKREQAQLACAETALAVERYRLAQKRWPDSLAKLSPALLPSVPLDPYTGAPLRYARKPEGVVIYSVGPDLVDDGGEILRHRPQGNYDIGFRLYDPGKRNLPALAEPAGP